MHTPLQCSNSTRRRASVLFTLLGMFAAFACAGCDTSGYDDQAMTSSDSQTDSEAEAARGSRVARQDKAREAGTSVAKEDPAGEKGTQPFSPEDSSSRPTEEHAAQPATTATTATTANDSQYTVSPEPKPFSSESVDSPPAAIDDSTIAHDEFESTKAEPGIAQPATEAESGLQVRLHPRTAVALAQSLPTGTAMGFSVEYFIRAGQPDPSSRYAWIIQAANGQTAASEINLQREGTLQTFVPQFRPDHGPFSCFLGELTKDGQQLKISQKLDFPP